MPDWPRSPALDVCKSAALAHSPPADPALAAAVKKIAGGLASSERALLAVPEYGDAIAARVALEFALAEGARLFTSAPAVDAGEVDALLKSSAEVADRLRAAEEKARAARELEKLQLFASASAALHREMLAFQDLAGRLRSAKAVPRSVALDPAAARPAAPPSDTAPPVREEEPRKFFSGFDRRGRLVLLAALVALFLGVLVRALFFGGPAVEELEPVAAGPDVAEVRISGNSAAVVVRKNWRAGGLPQLIAALRPRGVTSAVLLLESGAGLAQLDVTSGKLYGGPRADAGP